jgi:hypothetical protein
MVTATGDCTPVAVSCRSNPAVCGTHGSCIPGPDFVQDSCSCQPGYTGNACQACADGYTAVGTLCEPTCKTMPLVCAGMQVCSDASGRRACVCPGNRTGVNCDQCPSGWVLRASDGMCVQTCTAVAPTCGTRKYCDESQGMPVCVCLAQYAGADCSACAPGYMPDGSGQCIRNAPAGTTLLAGGRFQNNDYLVAIDGAAGTATPLRPLTGLSGARLATDVAGHVIYTLSGTTVSRLDPATGKPTTLATLRSAQAITFGGGALYTVGSLTPYLLTRVDPTSGLLSDLGPTNLVGAQGYVGLGWDPGGSLLYARPPTTGAVNGAELFRVDSTTGANTMLGAVTAEPERLRPADNRVSLAFDRAGQLFLATRLGRTPTDVVLDHCRKVAAGLGYLGYETAPFTTTEINQMGIGAGMTRVLTSKNPSGKEIVAYVSSGQRGIAKAFARVQTTNPETFVCLSTVEEVLELQIPAAQTRFAGIALTSGQPYVTMAVEGAVENVAGTTVHLYVASGSAVAACAAYSFCKVYSSSEWSQRRLPTNASVWSGDPGAPVVLLEIDPATRAIKRNLSFAGVELYPSIAPWAP